MTSKSLTQFLLAGVVFTLGILPSSALERYDTWVQGDTVRLCKGQTALIIFASPDCQVKMTRPGCKAVTLQIEPTAKVVPSHPSRIGTIISYVDPAVAKVTSPRNPIVLVGPVTLTLENSSGPKRYTSYVSALITETEF